MPDIEAITFDVGGTLITPTPSVGHVYAEVASAYGLSGLSPQMLDERFVAAWKAHGGQAESRSDWKAIVLTTFEGLGPMGDFEGLFTTLYERFAIPSSWKVFSDVLPTLAALRAQGTRLAIISNWDDRLPLLLDRLGLSHHFEVITVSYEIGWRKPQRQIFDATLENLRLDADRVLHVGDSQEYDIDGARRAGLHAVGIRRHSIIQDPDWIDKLTRLTDLAAAIQ